MTDAIVLYHNPRSRGRIAHWMLEEAGVPYRVELIDFAKGEHKTPSFLAINPMGKLPTVLHGSTVVTEAAAICAYVADAFPSRKLAPALDDPARGPYLRWLFFGAGCVEPALVDRMFDRPMPDRPGALGYGSYGDVLHALETALHPGPFVLGERFSAADVYLGSEIVWGLMAKTLEPRPAFLHYYERLQARPAFQRSAEQDEAFTKQAQATTN